MFSIPVHVAIAGSIAGNLVLAAVFYYLWRTERRELALACWSGAYLASAGRVAFKLLGLDGVAAAIYGEAVCGSAMVVLLWIGARAFLATPVRSPWRDGALALLAMATVALLAAAGFLPVIVPYLVAGGVFFVAGLALLRRGRREPGVGYGLVGVLMAMYGGHAFVLADLSSGADDPRAYVFAPIVNLALGMLLLVTVQRKQQFATLRLNEALQREAAGRRAAEAVGGQSESRYRAILDSTRSLIGLLAPDGTLLDINRAALDALGLARADVVDRPFWETPWWTHDAAQQMRLRQAIRRVAAGGVERFEATHIQADGTPGDFDFFLSPIRDAAGRVRYLVPEAHDITARKRTERALRDSELQLSRVFYLLPDLVTISTIEDGRFIDVNHHWRELLGFTREEAIGRTTVELDIWVYPDQRRQLVEDVRRHGMVRGREITIRAKDGHPVICEISGSTFEWQGQRLLLLVTRDVTAQRALERAREAAERALREREAQFSTFFAVSPEPLAVVRFDDAIYVDVNPAWLSTFGYERDEVIGRTPYEIDLWIDREERRRLIGELELRGVVSGDEVWYRRKDGSRLLAEISARIFELGGVRHVLWDVHDVTEKRRAADALRVSREMFATAFFNGPDYLTLSHLSDGRLIEVNEAFERFTGYGRDEAIGHTAGELGIWVNADAREQWVETLRRQGFVREYEAILAHRDGRWRIALVNAAILEIEGEECVIAVVREITEQRRIELALRESEEKFSTVFHQLPVAIAVTTRDDGTYIDVNEAWLRQFDYTREEVIGKSGRELNFWVDPAVRSKLAEHLAGRPDFLQWEIDFRARDGRIVPTECSGRVFELGGEEVVIWSAPDMTERRNMEQAVRQSEEKFSAIFHRSPIALGVTTVPTGRYLDINTAWERQFGYRRDDMLGNTSLDVGLWLDVNERTRLFADADRGERIQNRLVHFRCGDGREVLCELAGEVFDLGGERVFLWGAHDVTEHRRVQSEIEELNLRLEARVQERTASLKQANAELEGALETLKLAQTELVRAEKLAALGSLVAGVAHELNTPLGNSVTVASTLLERTREFAEESGQGKLRRSILDDYVGEARAATELLMRNLTQANELVSSFKQVAVDQTSAQRRRFDLRLVLEEVLATLAPMVKRTPFKLEAELADNVVMDSFPGPLGQILTNLVANSLIHGFEGRDKGEMRVVALQLEPRFVEIGFSDDGVGISPSDMTRIFDPFFTTKLGRGGSGLGLNIVYNLVTRVLGGRIAVASTPDGGTRFQITLPLTAPHADERRDGT